MTTKGVVFVRCVLVIVATVVSNNYIPLEVLIPAVPLPLIPHYYEVCVVCTCA